MAKNVVYVYCEEDRTRTCWVLSSVLLKFSISYLGSRKIYQRSRKIYKGSNLSSG